MNMSGERLLYPNLGADEYWQADVKTYARHAWWKSPQQKEFSTLARLCRLWQLMFGKVHQHFPAIWPSDFSNDAHSPTTDYWPTLMQTANDPIWPGLIQESGVWPWLSTRAGQSQVESAGLGWAGADPNIVARWHDKGHCHRRALELGLVDETWARLVQVWDADDLADEQVVWDRLEHVGKKWPSEWAGQMTLKPRFGSSGRGRVPGLNGTWRRQEIATNLERLAKRGGVIWEPIVSRQVDLAGLFWIDSQGLVVHLGTLTMLAGRSGSYVGHQARYYPETRRFGLTHPEWEAPFGSACQQFLQTASAEGLRGPVGIDGFVYHRPDAPHKLSLRPVVECNARFTAGHVILALLERLAPLAFDQTSSNTSVEIRLVPTFQMNWRRA